MRRWPCCDTVTWKDLRVALGEDSDHWSIASKNVGPQYYNLNSAQNAKQSPRLGWGSGRGPGLDPQGPKPNKTNPLPTPASEELTALVNTWAAAPEARAEPSDTVPSL